MRILLLDNYDSFSHILFQYLWELMGEEPLFVRNDEWGPDRLRSESFQALVISPGPGHPAHPRDFGICADALRSLPGTPMLGICLGLQGMALAAGAKVGTAPAPRHGKLSPILHDGEGLFAGLPQGFAATRYHSLAIDPASVGPGLIVTATAQDDGQIMGARLSGRPAFGVQFHPESIGTAYGKRLLGNFRDLARAALRVEVSAEADAGVDKAGAGTDGPDTAVTATAGTGTAATKGAEADHSASIPPSASTEPASVEPPSVPSVPLLLEARVLPWRDPEDAFAHWFRAAPAAFWLDSLSEPVPGEPRMTYMGSGSVLYEAKDGACRKIDLEGTATSATASMDPAAGSDPFPFLDRALRRGVPCMLPEHLGFPGSFRGGLIGYFGYELKRFADGGDRAGLRDPDLPEALFVQPDRMLAFDPAGRRAWAFLPCGPDGPTEEARAWLARVEAEWDIPALPPFGWERLPADPRPRVPDPGTSDPGATDPGATDPEAAAFGTEAGFRLPWRAAQEHPAYLEEIRSLQHAILRGESYEACLTNELRAACAADPFEAYRFLRRVNPAPYAAFLRFPGHEILCASPERFLKLDATGRLECRPIKGTRPRGADPASDAAWRDELASHPKDRSENLMIVDLMRNDFGKVCALGSVDVPDLMRVEPHPSVWQLVSTVTGRLAPGRRALDAVRACFPAGSMTGAPKRRTMELLEAAERRPRGIFSGALGYLGWDGAMDLGMVIRTLVRVNGGYRIGCGGAILAESDPESEWSEAMLKASAPMRALELAAFKDAKGWKTRSG